MRALLTLLALVSLSAHAAGLLNDTGVTTCFDGANLVTCSDANTGDSASYPRQDARFGRDAARAAGQLPAKIGGGAAGFDFTPLDASGNPIAIANGVPVSPPSCTRDNVTGLIWEVKTVANMDTGFNEPDALNYPNITNADGLCGAHSGWRVPTRRELLSIVHFGTDRPSIDTNYFPNTKSAVYTGALGWAYGYWTSETCLFSSYPMYWFVEFGTGTTYCQSSGGLHVRLVRSGQ
jgi:hypothetical protein